MASPLVGPSSAPPNMPSDHPRQGRFSLLLGDGLKQDSSSSKTLSSVRFNHKPRLSTGSRKTKLRSTGQDSCRLKITDTDGDKKSRYTYAGERRDSKGQYVLLFDHAKQLATLERISASYDVNLESTPQGASPDTLKERYPHIPPPNEDQGEANGFNIGDEPDPNNPFDYRHFLKASQSQNSIENDRAISRSPSPLPQNASKVHATSTMASSLPHSPMPASSPAGRSPMVRPSKSIDVLRPMNSKKRKVESSKPTSKPSQSQITPEKKLTPSVRLERRASTRPVPTKSTSGKSSKPVPLSEEYVHSSDDEDPPPLASTKISSSSEPAASSGALEIDLSATPPQKPVQNHRKILGAVLGTPNQGPISLRSAANSPNARNSPLHMPKRRRTGPAEIDFGSDLDVGDNDDRSGKEKNRRDERDAEGEDEDAEGDEDVDPISLGSPAHADVVRPKSFAEIEGEEKAEGDGLDDFEAELMHGFFDDGPGNAVAEEEESDVSEAE